MYQFVLPEKDRPDAALCCLKNAFPADDNLLPFQASSCAPMTLEHGAPIAVAKMSSHLAPILNM